MTRKKSKAKPADIIMNVNVRLEALSSSSLKALKTVADTIADTINKK